MDNYRKKIGNYKDIFSSFLLNRLRNGQAKLVYGCPNGIFNYGKYRSPSLFVVVTFLRNLESANTKTINLVRPKLG